MGNTALVGILMATGLSATDFSGIWIGKMPARNDDFVDVAFQFTQKGSSIGGKLYGDYQSTPIATGTASGDLVTFVVVAPEQAGNQINETRLRFTGKLVNGELELTRERESSKNAGNGGSYQESKSSKQTIRIKKLI